MSSYPKVYLYDAMEILGEAFHTAKHELSIELDDFLHMLVISGIANQFEKGNVKYIAGKCGREIAYLVYEKIFGSTPSYDTCTLSAITSPEYWCGWILSYYQWYSGHTFQSIQNVISMDVLCKKYHPFHEADERRTAAFIDKQFQSTTSLNRLQEYRKRIALSQSELSKISGINIRSIQQYEIGAKDIKKASASTVLALSKALSCSTEDLIS